MPAQSTRPLFESLEDRRMLAADLRLDGSGRLHGISTEDGGQVAGLTLTAQPGNRLTVAEGATVYGTFEVAPTLEISLGETQAGFVNRLDLNNQTLEANVRVELGNTAGLNQFRLTTAAAGEGTLDGNYAVRGGDTGSEFIVFGDFGQTAPRTINVTGSVKIDAGAGGRDPASGPPDAVATVGTGANSTLLNVGGNFKAEGSTVLALAGSVGGNLASDSSGKEVGQLVILGNYSLPFAVGGNVKIATGDAADEVDVQGSVIGGNLDVRTNGGSDLVRLTNDEDATGSVPTRVGGNVSVDLGEGDDAAEIVDLAIEGRNVAIEAGNGADTITLETLHAPDARLRALLGAGDDAFGFGGSAEVDLAGLFIDGGPGLDVYGQNGGNSLDFPVRVVNVP